jgi:hypothetical protein
LHPVGLPLGGLLLPNENEICRILRVKCDGLEMVSLLHLLVWKL